MLKIALKLLGKTEQEDLEDTKKVVAGIVDILNSNGYDIRESMAETEYNTDGSFFSGATINAAEKRSPGQSGYRNFIDINITSGPPHEGDEGFWDVIILDENASGSRRESRDFNVPYTTNPEDVVNLIKELLEEMGLIEPSLDEGIPSF